MEQFNEDYKSGESSYDITKFVTPNNSYEGNVKKSNCHGFAYNAILGGTESQLEPQDNQYINFLKLFERKEKTESPKTGDLAVFYLSKDYYVGGVKISKNDAQHTGIFIIKDRAGNAYFINRPNSDEAVRISTIKDILEKYNQVKPKAAPPLRELPDYFHKK